MSDSTPEHGPRNPQSDRDREPSELGGVGENGFAFPKHAVGAQDDENLPTSGPDAENDAGEQAAAEEVGLSPEVETLMTRDPAAESPPAPPVAPVAPVVPDTTDASGAADATASPHPAAAAPSQEVDRGDDSIKEPRMADETTKVELAEVWEQEGADGHASENDETQLITTSPDELASDAVTSNPDETAAVELDEFDLSDPAQGSVMTIPMIAHPLDTVRSRHGDAESYELAEPGRSDAEPTPPRKLSPAPAAGPRSDAAFPGGAGGAGGYDLQLEAHRPARGSGSKGGKSHKGRSTTRTGSGSADAGAEWIPRGLILVQCLWLLGSWAVALTLDSQVPAMRWMVISAVVGMLAIWPALRLSQGHPRLMNIERPPARPSPPRQDNRLPVYLLTWPPALILRDCIALIAVFQAVIWPLRLSAGWSLGQTLWLDAAAAAWTLLIGAITAWGALSPHGARRSFTMILCMLVLGAEPLVAGVLHWFKLGGDDWRWHMRISPVEVLWVTTRPHAGAMAHWPATIAAAAAAAGVIWLAVFVAGRRRAKP